MNIIIKKKGKDLLECQLKYINKLNEHLFSIINIIYKYLCLQLKINKDFLFHHKKK